MTEQLLSNPSNDDSRPRQLLAAERRSCIVDMVNQDGSVRVEQLASMFDVSDVTIRSDLDLLATQGLILRTRGGAVPAGQASLTTAFDQRAKLNLEEKRRIGRFAAQMVEPGDTIIMDAGTTLMEMAKAVNSVSPLTVVTNALNVAMQVGALPHVRVILVGGSLNTETISTVGHHAMRDFEELIVRKVFLGVHALDHTTGLTDLSIEVAQVKQAMVHAARQVILLADSSKWGRMGFVKVIPLAAVHTWITDTDLPTEARQLCERLGVRLVLV